MCWGCSGTLGEVRSSIPLSLDEFNIQGDASSPAACSTRVVLAALGGAVSHGGEDQPFCPAWWGLNRSQLSREEHRIG